MLKCNKCSEFVHKNYLVICAKCEFCYHQPCVLSFINENQCFVCENCRINDKKLEEIKEELENVERRVFDLEAVNEDNLVSLIVNLRDINEEIFKISNNYEKEICGLVEERLDVVGNCAKKLLFNVEEIEDELKIFEDFGKFVDWIEEVGQKSVGSVQEAEILLEEIIQGKRSLGIFLDSIQKLDKLEEDYLVVINDFRVSKNLEGIKSFPNLELRENLSKTVKNYNELLGRVKKFLDWISDGQNLRENTEESLTKAGKFLEDLEPKVKLLVEEPIAKEPRLLKKQEKRAKILKNQLIANKNLMEDVLETSSKFLKTYEDFVSPQEITESVKILENKYEDFSKVVEIKHQKIFQTLTYSQENLEIWMKTMEEKFKSEEKFASLIPKILDQQIIGQKLLITEIETQISSLDSQKIENRAKKMLKISEDQEKFFQEVKKDLTDFNQNRDNLLKFCEEIQKDGYNPNFLTEIEENLKQKKQFFDETKKLGSKLLENQRIIDKETVEENLGELEEEWREINLQLEKKLGEVQISTDSLIKLKEKVKKLSLKIDQLTIKLKTSTTKEQIKSIEEDYIEIKEELSKIKEDNKYTKQLKQKTQQFLKQLHKKKLEIKENETKNQKIKELDNFLSEVQKKMDCIPPTSLNEAQNLLNDLQILQLKIFEKQPLFEQFQYKTNIIEKMDGTLKWLEKYKEFYAIYDLLSVTEFTDVQLRHLGDIVETLLEDSRTDGIIEEKYRQLCQKKLSGTEKEEFAIEPELKNTNLEEKIDNITDKLTLDKLELQIKNQETPELQKKLNHRRAEIENSIIEEKEFKVACAKLQGWITLKMIPNDFAISAHKIKLLEQFAKYSDLQKEILEKEHEFVMLDRNNNESFSEFLQENWGKLKNGASKRFKSLQNAKESCDLFYGELDCFLGKLQVLEVVQERSFQDLKPRDLTTYDEDCRKILRSGEDFLRLCDIDKKGVEDEIRGVSEKWRNLKTKVKIEDQKLGEICLMIGDFMGELREFQDLAKIKGKYRELSKICSENNVNIQGIKKEYKKLVKVAEKRLREEKEEDLKRQKVKESLREFRGSIEAQKSKLANFKTVESPVINKESIEEHIGELKNLGVEIEEIAKEVKVLDFRASELDFKVSELGLKTSELDLNTSKLDLKDSESDLKTSELKTSKDLKNSGLDLSEIDLKTSNLGLKTSNLDLETSNLDLKTSKLDINTSKSDLKNLQTKISNLDFKDQKLDLMDSKLNETSKLDLQDSDLGLKTSNLELKDSDLDSKASNLDFNASKLELKTSELNTSKMDLKMSKLDLNDSKLDLNDLKLDLNALKLDLNNLTLDLNDAKVDLKTSELNTSNFDIKTSNSDLKTSNLDFNDSKLDLKASEFNTSNLDLKTSNSDLKTSNLDFNDSVLNKSKFDLKTSELNTSNLDLKTSNLDFKDSKLDLKTSELNKSKLDLKTSELNTSNLDLKTSNSDLKTSNLDFNDSVLNKSKLDLKTSELNTSNLDLKTSNSDLKTSNLDFVDSKLYLKTSELNKSKVDLKTSELNTSNLDLKTSNSDLKTSNLDFNDSQLDLKTSELNKSKLDLKTSELNTSNLDLKTSNSDLKTSNLDFNDSKLDLKTSELNKSKLDLKTSELNTSNLDLKTSNSDLKTSNLDFNDSVLNKSKLDLKTSELNTSNFDIKTSNSDLKTSNPDIKTSKPDIKTSNSDLKTSNLDFNDSKLDLKTSELNKSKLDLKTSELNTSNLDLKTSNSDLKTSNLDFNDSQLDLKTSELNKSKLDLKTSELNTSNLDIKTSNSDLKTSNLDFNDSKLDLKTSELNTSNFDIKTSNSDLKTSELNTSNFDIKTSNSDLKTSNPDIKTSKPDIKTSNSDLKTSNLDFNNSQLDLKTSELNKSKLDIKTSNLDLKTSNLDLNTSKLDLKDSESKTSNLDLQTLEMKTAKDLNDSELNVSEIDLKTSKLDLETSKLDLNISKSDLKNSEPKTSNLDFKGSELDLKSSELRTSNDSEFDASEIDLRTSKLDLRTSKLDFETSKMDLNVSKLDLKTEVKPLKLKVEELQKNVKNESKKWHKTLQDLQEFTEMEKAVKKILENADSLDFDSLGKPQLKVLEVKVLGPLEAKIGFFNNLGHFLVDLTDEESKGLEVKAKLIDVNQKTQNLYQKINGQLEKLDLRLIEEGKIREALEDLEIWLINLEEIVENLKAPSSESKILRRQILEVKKLQSKLLEGRKPWLNGEEKIEGRLDNLEKRLEDRLRDLEKILEASEIFEKQMKPILSYIEEAEENLLKILDLEEEDLTEKLRELRILQFKNLECQKNLTSNSKFGSEKLKIANLIKETNENIDLLDKLDKNLQLFHGFTQWLEKIEVKLRKLTQIPVFEKQLLEHEKQLKVVKEDIEGHQMTIREIKDVLHLLPMSEDLNESQLKNTEQKYQEILTQTLLLQKTNEDFRPIVQDFHENYAALREWISEAQKILSNPEVSDREVISLEIEVTEYKPLLDILSHLLLKISEITPLSSELSEKLSNDTQKFTDLEQKILGLSEKVAKNKRRFFEVYDEVEELQNWLRNAEEEINEIGRPSSDPYQISQQLLSQKQLQSQLNEKQNNIKLTVKEVQEILRESPQNEDMTSIKEKTEDLQEILSKTVKNNREKLENLKEALELAEDFHEVHNILDLTLEELEEQVTLISDLQENNEVQKQTTDNKTLLEKLNKNGETLIQICAEDSTSRIQELLENNNSRFSRLKSELRNQQENFERILMENSQLTEKLDGILEVLNHTKTQVKNLEPIASNPEKIREQIQDNQILIKDLEKRKEAYDSVTESAKTIIQKAENLDLTDIQKKLENLEKIWKEVQEMTKKRAQNLQETLIIAQKFWDEVQNLRTSIKSIEEALENLEPPSAHFTTIKKQQVTLETIKEKLETTNLDHLKETDENFLKLPEIRKQISDVRENLETTTQLFWKREKNLLSAMEKVMEFHDTITTVQQFLDQADIKFEKLNSNTTNINEVQTQLEQLRNFKKEVEPHVIKLETLSRQAQELSETTPTNHENLVVKPLQNLKNRLDDLQLKIAGQESDLERLLLELGDFDLALNQFFGWLEVTNGSVDKIVPSGGNLGKLELELAKMLVLNKDIQGHRLIVDELLATKANPDKLGVLEFKWLELTEKSKLKLKELENFLKEAVKFTEEVNDEILFLEEVGNREVFRKPVGGLQETAQEQLKDFMLVFEEIEDHRPKIEVLLQMKDQNLGKKLQILKQQWDLVSKKALDRKIKLEIALKEAQSFQDSFQEFADWLTSAEHELLKLKPISRLWKVVEVQMQENQKFLQKIADHRVVMFNLDKKGNQLKYFTQREDSALIRNLLVSLEHRWDRINNKVVERTLDLNLAFKEAKEFNDCFTNLTNWLTEAEENLDQLLTNNLDDSQKLRKIEDLLRSLREKQRFFDRVIRLGNNLKYKALKDDLPVINEQLSKLREKYKILTNKTLNGQRKLEKQLLKSGQYKDTIQSLTQWLKKAEKDLTQENPIHGDLDFVSNLLDNHRLFTDELESRSELIESLTNQPEFPDLQQLYKKVDELTKTRTEKLKQALEDAQKLAQKTKQLTDWMTEAEQQLNNIEDIPDNENQSNKQLQFLTQFRANLNKIKPKKEETCNFALEIIQKSNSEAIPPIKNTIKDINNQWNRITRTLFQKHQKLLLKLKHLEEFDKNLEDLIQWILSIEKKIQEDNQTLLPTEIAKILDLIEKHKRFMKDVEKRQLQVDKLCRSRRPKTQKLQLDIKPPRVQFLYDKWREVWFLLWDRQQKLRNHLVYLKDKEKADKFSWDDWRRRFLKFMGYKKSRVVDLLKKLDKDQNDLIPSEEFIDGILRTKFDTNRLEMLQLVKMFDQENKELIDWRQFLKALRPEWEEKPTNVDDAKILTEFKKIVMMCKCKERIKVVHVGDGRYKIGDNQKIRLVRILKSTVMVRVGGGWVTLQEFLKKNDPCRTIGRTNLELREKYLLPEGTSQALAAFRSKFFVPSPKIIQGPVFKIREKTEKSLGMSYVTKTQFSYQTIQPLVRSKPNSRLGSRQNSFVKSRPASALGSRQGSFVLDGSKSRIPRLKLTNIPPPKQDFDFK